MIDANTPVTVVLPASAMDVIMMGLRELPYKHAQPIIDELRRQILDAQPTAFDTAAQPSTATPPRVNGIDAVQG
jgi:hypothetical protein